MLETIYTVIIALFTGFSSGMFGIGGSAVATPLLILFLGVSSITALASPILAAVPSAISGSYIYFKKGMINFRIAGFTLISAVPFSVLSTYLTSVIDVNILIIAKAVMLMLLGMKFFLTSILLKDTNKSIRNSIYISLLTGALAGSIAGILAIGGGIVFVTGFVRINRLPMKNAVATSLFCVGIVAIINSTYQIILGHVDLKLALILGISVIPASIIGAKLSSRLKNKTLEFLFGSLMIALSVYFIISRIS